MLIDILILIIVVGTVLWAARALLGAFGIGDPIRTVVYVLLVLLLLAVVLNWFGFGGGLIGGSRVLGR